METNQLSLPLGVDRPPGMVGLRAWLLATDEASWPAVRGLLESPHLIVDAGDASSTISRADLVLLRDPRAGNFELFASEGSCTDQDAVERSISTLFLGTLDARPARSTDALILGGASLSAEAPRLGSASTDLERLIAQLAAPRLLPGHLRRRLLCREFIQQASGTCDPDLRSLLQLEAQRHRLREGDADEILDAWQRLRRQGLKRLVLQGLNAVEGTEELQGRFPWGPSKPPARARLGFATRKVSALCLGTRSQDPGDTQLQPTRSRVRRLTIPREQVINILRGVESRIVRLHAVELQRATSASDRHIEVSVDWEMRVLAAVAGRCGGSRTMYTVEMSSETCKMCPEGFRLGVGGRRHVSVTPQAGRRHVVEVTAYDGRGHAVRSRVRLSAGAHG